jgi:multicomponent Na+:H+ antiporter subunit E
VKRLVCFLLVLVLWILLTWPADWAAWWQDLAAGVVFSLLIAALASEIYPQDLKKVFNPKRWLFLLAYIPMFFWEVLKANFDVAYRVLHPDVPIRPGIVKVRTELTTEMGRTFLANSITLTPGTLTVDVDGQDLYVHWIYIRGKDIEAHTRQIVARFERMLKEIFE